MNKKTDATNIIRILEQTETGLENAAKLLGGYYEALLETGIPEELAMRLVIGLQESMLRAGGQ